ncbi:MAG: DNA polymerase I [Gammaproteobacteria bacterium]|nr:MAG: DNA polymerase I [Gammaproteobacteria bacterium]
MDNKKFVLVDGSYYMFRAYHGMPELSNGKGEPTGAIFGVINMLRKLINEYQPDYLAVVFDAKGKTFRSDMYAEYKAHRPPMPDDLVCQIAPIHTIIRALGLPLLIIDDVEADDVIGTLATQASAQGLKTYISSGDKDLAQLVDDHVRLVNTMNNTVLDRDGVIEKYGVAPSSIIDYLALMGDSSDNVPGVPKVGPKTAVKWLTEHGSLQKVVEHADEIKGKVGESLRANLELLYLSKELVTLKLDVDLEFKPHELVQAEPDKEALREAYSHWQFRSWLSELDQTENNNEQTSVPANPGPAAGKSEETAEDPVPVQKKKMEIKTTDKQEYETILTSSDLDRWLKKLQQSELFAFDTETTSLDYMQAQLVGVSFSVEAGEAAYVPVAHDYEGAPEQLSRELVLEKLCPLLEDPDQPKLGQNIKYDKNILANYDINLTGIAHDTMLESYVLDSTASRHDMDSLALNYLQRTTTHYEDVAGKGSKQITFNQVTIEEAAPYAAEDADITLQLHQNFWPELQQNKKLQHIYQSLEIPLLSVLSQVERNGVMVDADMLGQQSHELESRMGELEQQAHDLAKQTFNIGSPKQIQKILYEDMQLPILAKTPKGQPSTAESVLQELAQDYDLPRLILDYRSLSKLKSTYTDKLPGQIDADTGRVHTSYHQAVAATGRLSSSDPNLQNIPIRTEEGRRIRQAFIAPENCVLLAADYSQIELRIMAHLSQDKGLLEAFSQNEDVHRKTAAEVFSTTIDKVSNEQRRAAKAINFGLIYGMSPFGLAKQLGISRSEAKDYVDRYFERYPDVKNYMEITREQAREKGYVETVFGRRLYLPEINARNAARRQYAERTAINAPMQGTAADIIKRAMIDIQACLNKDYPEINLIMQVHDELVFEIPKNKVEALKPEIINIMTRAADLSVPLLVDIGTGNNWDAAH